MTRGTRSHTKRKEDNVLKKLWEVVAWGEKNVQAIHKVPGGWAAFSDKRRGSGQTILSAIANLKDEGQVYPQKAA